MYVGVEDGFCLISHRYMLSAFNFMIDLILITTIKSKIPVFTWDSRLCRKTHWYLLHVWKALPISWMGHVNIGLLQEIGVLEVGRKQILLDIRLIRKFEARKWYVEQKMNSNLRDEFFYFVALRGQGSGSTEVENF